MGCPLLKAVDITSRIPVAIANPAQKLVKSFQKTIGHSTKGTMRLARGTIVYVDRGRFLAVIDFSTESAHWRDSRILTLISLIGLPSA